METPSVLCHVELDEALLTIPINPNNFPAKLWRLVNSPENRSICWDSRGEGVIIDQHMFECELLSPMKPTGEPVDLFKTTNFTSFIRQLNLYGFRKVVLGSGGSAGNDINPGGDLVVAEGILHHFHNPHFKKDHPELLVNLKRLTSANKAKLEAGLEVTCRPPNRLRRLLTSSVDPMEKVKMENHCPVSAAQIHRAFHRESAAPYPCNPGGLYPMKGLDRTPIPQRGWPSSLGLIMGQMDGSSPFSDKGIPVSVLQRFPTDVTCALQSSPTTVHMQQGSQGMGPSGQKFGNYMTSPAQFRPAYYPAAMCQCCSPGSVDPMTGCAHQNTSNHSHYNYYQNLTMQPSYPVEFLHAGNQNWPSICNEDHKKTDINLETVFQMVNELQASPKPCMVKVEPTESQLEVAQPAMGQQLPGNSFSALSTTAKATSAQLGSLTPVVSDASSLVADAAQKSTCSENQFAGFIYPVSTTSLLRAMPILDNTAVPIVQNQSQGQACSGSVAVTQLDISQKVLNNTENVVRWSETAAAVLSGTQPFKAGDKDTDSCTPATPSECKSSRQQSKSPDLNLLVDVACKQEPCQGEEEEGYV
ncbi:heat shock factor protein 5 [Polyodon spathula]|uniref:heat shock factor protein 5 n=1 Tax=Polyodon spathula TaxID=7913 RepID=UPI001B7D9876|nr:heat shock factor protein 5 [Polyodon spathula]